MGAPAATTMPVFGFAAASTLCAVGAPSATIIVHTAGGDVKSGVVGPFQPADVLDTRKDNL